MLQLFPPPVREQRLSGLYLEESLPRPAAGAAPFLYANFVTSLDGRIAVTGTAGALRLRTLYLDPAGDDGAGQLFASFEPA